MIYYCWIIIFNLKFSNNQHCSIMVFIHGVSGFMAKIQKTVIIEILDIPDQTIWSCSLDEGVQNRESLDRIPTTFRLKAYGIITIVYAN